MSLPDGTLQLLRQLDLLRIEANYTRQWTRGTRFTRAQPVAPPRFDDAQYAELVELVAGWTGPRSCTTSAPFLCPCAVVPLAQPAILLLASVSVYQRLGSFV